MVFANGDEQAIVALGNGWGRAAFKHFAGIPGGGWRQLRANGGGGPRRGIAATAGQDDLRAVVQGLDKRFRPHHADDAAGTVDDGVGQLRLMRQAVDTAGGVATLESILVLLGVDQSHLEMQPVFPCDF